MADKIKKFFKKKKADATFKRAGPGYKLNSSTPSESTSRASNKEYQPLPNRTGLTQESKQAAEAALARLGQKQHNTAFNT